VPIKKEKTTIYYFEKLEFLSLVVFVFKKKSHIQSQDKIFYIDTGYFFSKAIIPILSYFKLNFESLSFKLTDIRDKNGELIRLRIPRVDLFKFEHAIIKSKSFTALYDPFWRQSELYNFIVKGLTDGQIYHQESVSKLLFLFEVIDRNNTKYNSRNSFFFIKNRPWLEVYKNFASKYKISLYETPSFYGYVTAQDFPCLYFLGKYLQLNIFKKNKYKFPVYANNLFVNGRGDINFENDGYHSDYFWCLNSKFPTQNITTKCLSEKEADYFAKHNTVGSWMDVNLKDLFDTRIYKYQNRGRGIFNYEYSQIKHLISRYNTIRTYWESVLKKNKVKIFLTWDKYDITHIAISDAVRNCGGVSAVWQMAYDGFKYIECRFHADINFSFSKFSCEVDESEGSICKYQVITGYPKTYAKPLLMEKALALRERMQSAGAEQILFVIDENASADSRWHTGYSFQQENYTKPLQALFSNPSLGLIFKPKNVRTLETRLGKDVYDQIIAAKETGRCYLYDDLGLRNYTTAAPPMLAALSADLCIHGHLSGTAAMECALLGKPTLLIDREGVPFHKFYDLLTKELVIFDNWDDAIAASIKFFKSNKSISGFGDWSSIINELDPFHDEKAAYRMGSYLDLIRRGFERGLDRDNAMLEAAEVYSKKWGSDKIIVN